jgi:molecular chaperone DnaJ
MARDYYEILGVERTADAAALKASFRKLAMQHHPDRNAGCTDSEAKFKELNEAYSILADPQKRAAYDRYGHAGVNGANGHAQQGDINDIFSSVFGEAFGDMFARQRGGGGPARGSDLRYDLEITLEEAYAGAQKDIVVPSTMACETCDGSGAKPGTSPVTCMQCGGMGRVRATQGFFSVERACPRCGGTGQRITDPCTTCHGHGQVRRERTLQVRIPAGVDDGARIRLSGEGDAGGGAAPAAISTSSCRSRRTSCSSATAWTCCAPCPCPCGRRRWAARSRRPASSPPTATLTAGSRSRSPKAPRPAAPSA